MRPSTPSPAPPTSPPLLSAADLATGNAVAAEVGDILHRTGMAPSGWGAIQADINPAIREIGGSLREITVCDHNCTTEVDGVPTGGSYTCPAALSLNRGVGKPEMAPTDRLVTGLVRAVAGLRAAREEFLDGIFPGYVRDMAVPPVVAEVMLRALRSDDVVVNLFGGSPELHPGYLEICRALQDAGAAVHLTTTGRRILKNERFREAFLESPPDLLALGADDFASPADAQHLFSLSLDELRRQWRSVPWQHGQRKKALEAVQLVKMAESDARFPPLLFNVVMHDANLGEFEELLDVLTKYAPAAVLNPYPAQTAFLQLPGSFDDQRVAEFARLVDRMIAEHRSLAAGTGARWNLVPRMYYWLMLQAAIENATGGDDARDRIAGWRTWNCYERAGAGRCVQIAAGSGGVDPEALPGGHLGCFWNTTTVTDPRHVWDMTTDEVARWLWHDRLDLAREAPRPCGGCAFPRMSLDAVSLEIGLDDTLRPDYLRLRSAVLGY